MLLPLEIHLVLLLHDLVGEVDAEHELLNRRRHHLGLCRRFLRILELHDSNLVFYVVELHVGDVQCHLAGVRARASLHTISH